MADEEYSRASADADREMTRLWRTWRTVFEMLADRVWFIPISRHRYAAADPFLGVFFSGL